MTPLLHDPNVDFRRDDEPRALYYAEYRRTYEHVRKLLEPGQRVNSEMAQKYALPIALVGNTNLKWTDFDFRSCDREILFDLPPGKSAHFHFGDHESLSLTKDQLNRIVNAVLNRNAKRQDRLHLTSISQVEAVGFDAYWTPMPNHPLHIRLIPTLVEPEARDLPRKIKEHLADIWRVAPIKN